MCCLSHIDAAMFTAVLAKDITPLETEGSAVEYEPLRKIACSCFYLP